LIDQPLFPEEKMEQLRTAKRTGLKGLLVTIMLVTLVLLIVVTRQLVEKYQSESATADLSDVEPIQELTRNDQESSGLPSAPAPLLPTKNAIDGLEVNLEKKESVASIVTSNDSPKNQQSIMNTATPPPKSNAEEERPSVQTKYVELIIEASDSVEMTIKRQNKEDEKIVLKPEQIHRIRLPSGFNLSFSNGGVVNLTHNGKDIGIPGQPGQPITLKY
ncbi:MAG: hypothetical protein N2578_02170, partial [Bdellovibrionaceae bacterium]|nr:hypothetical protein [Pseudobdellovibrionaceae bacterium]